MLYRKITTYIEDHLKSDSDKILILEGARSNLLKNPDYHIPSATVISNEREIIQDGKVTYIPVYFAMFMGSDTPNAEESDYIF